MNTSIRVVPKLALLVPSCVTPSAMVLYIGNKRGRCNPTFHNTNNKTHFLITYPSMYLCA
ncbi:hypothetical protein BO71DRAFT_159477 [Aspergillus ellipticus CBS 707.79]|uniref:Uncharacterized protein n=1 Tax=Aspergillus ellipticus CBS 707.79 TaxID=1448320 RepID=A0A319DRQ4_9EURO|nr:hypothetical protein BO71DRAFT_159477 [Aspergillus ellipticus CBS 707.79]